MKKTTTIKTYLTRFNIAEKGTYVGRTFITYRVTKLDDLTGLKYETTCSNLCIVPFSFKHLQGRQVQLTLTFSEKLGVWVVTEISVVAEASTKEVA